MNANERECRRIQRSTFNGVAFGMLFQAVAWAQPLTPSVTITRPMHGEIRLPGDVQLECNAVPSDFPVRFVEYRTNGNYLGRSMQAPFSMLWPDVASGRYVLEARVF